MTQIFFQKAFDTSGQDLALPAKLVGVLWWGGFCKVIFVSNPTSVEAELGFVKK